MSGYDDFNVPAFRTAKLNLEAKHGFEIQLPYDIENTAQPGWTWGDYLAEDIRLICNDCDGILLLPEWERSRGAKLEVATGLMQSLKFPEFTFHMVVDTLTDVVGLSAEVMAERWSWVWNEYSKEAKVA